VWALQALVQDVQRLEVDRVVEVLSLDRADQQLLGGSTPSSVSVTVWPFSSTL
jgi:hypothetical protein